MFVNTNTTNIHNFAYNVYNVTQAKTVKAPVHEMCEKTRDQKHENLNSPILTDVYIIDVNTFNKHQGGPNPFTCCLMLVG